MDEAILSDTVPAEDFALPADEMPQSEENANSSTPQAPASSWLRFWNHSSTSSSSCNNNTSATAFPPHPSTSSAYRHVEQCEDQLLSKLKYKVVRQLVPIKINSVVYHINTLETTTIPSTSSQKEEDTTTTTTTTTPPPLPTTTPPLPTTTNIPLLMLHGFAGGLGMFVKNFDALATKYKVYAIDCLGFGNSSRPQFPTDPVEAETMFVESIEAWRQSMELESFIFLGHSFGGYLSAAYALKYPHRVTHLILADPWGFPVRPPNPGARFPMWARMVFSAFRHASPLSVLRAAGPWGPRLLSRIRPDFGRKYEDVLDDPLVIYQYIYYLNSLKPSAELGFTNLTFPYGYAKMPMIERIVTLKEVPITFIYGRQSWMDYRLGEQTKELRGSNGPVDIHVLDNAGHHVYCDAFKQFNVVVGEIADLYPATA